ncbi:LiaI-LiaF-like domain-containing protein [Spirosoma flavum]|uniref:LiaI-LiaF-like domain-containing protein n=1 Tax=Spirosoma flavum TaxID=2048557 RepID=A0ABW6AHN9_9BACT
MQRKNGLFWGIFLLTLGVLFLARRAGWLEVDWHSLVNLWPLLLILAGVNLILERRGNPAAFVTTVMLAVAVPTTLFGFLARDRNHEGFNMRWNHDDDDNDDNNESDSDDDNGNDDNDSEDDYRSERERRNVEGTEAHSNTFAEAMDVETREAVLKLSGGAGRFIISDPTTELIKADTKQTVGTYSMSVDRDETTHIPTVELKPTEENQHVDLKDGNFENRVDVHLNATPVWTMDVALGAGQGDLDLSAYAVKSLKLAVGAADLDLKLGARSDQTDVKLNVGAASVTVRVPKEIGCRIKKDGALNIEQLDDFTDVGGGEFVSPGYDTAKKKMTIRFDGGISRFKVVRY